MAVLSEKPFFLMEKQTDWFVFQNIFVPLQL